jgi:hypothetical protein
MSSIRLQLPAPFGFSAFAWDRPRSEHPPLPPHLVTNPADDQEFRQFAMQVVSADGDPVAFLERLRQRYPLAAVHQRTLSGEPWLVWYVYREGRWIGRSGPEGEIRDEGETC